jgi:hypothetical protein
MPKFLDIVMPKRRQQVSGVVGLIIFQSDFVSTLSTTLVIPCLPLSANFEFRRLTPRLEIENVNCLAMVPQMASLLSRELTDNVIGEAGSIRDELIVALDLLVTGY